MHKIIVTLTTSPSRILLLEPVIQSILNQDYQIEGIEINVPLKYKNRDEYTIPDFLNKYDKVKVFRIQSDLGPATKIIPTLMRYIDNPDTFIVSVDDDHKYPKQIVSTLIKGLVLYGDKNIYTIGGINMFVGAKETLTGYNVYKTGKVDVLEGVFGVLYNPRLFTRELSEYINRVIQCKECLTSDDITISNYCHMKDISIIRLNFKSFNKWTLYKKIIFNKLEIKLAGQDKNAIHLMKGGHKKRYFKACVFLKENGLLYLNIR